jgi:hypothetical protein
VPDGVTPLATCGPVTAQVYAASPRRRVDVRGEARPVRVRHLNPWQGWQGSAFALVRLRSPNRAETRANGRSERTDANGRERSLAFAMQKVEGSSPFIRFEKAPLAVTRAAQYCAGICSRKVHQSRRR